MKNRINFVAIDLKQALINGNFSLKNSKFFGDKQNHKPRIPPQL
jgi:hypothetical protein